MSSEWTNNAEQERIVNRKKRLEEKRQQRAASNPQAFAWTKRDDGKYVCEIDGCEHEPFSTLAGALEHMHTHTLEDGQTGLGDWA